jgi:hypothetical protein
MVSLGKAVDEHERVQRAAQDIMRSECGVRHEKGARDDLCPSCVEFNRGLLPGEAVFFPKRKPNA